MKKLGIYLLIAAMLTQLAACGGGTSDETEAGTEAAAETTETTRIQHSLSNELDFGGASFCAAFLANDPSLYFAEESSSDNMVAALYRRVAKTEEFLGVDISYAEDVAVADFQTLYKAGDDEYQQLFISNMTQTIPFTTGGYMYNLDELPYLDLTAEWWNYEQMQVLKLGKYPYFAVSDFMITSPAAILFNRDMITDNNLENPYDLVFAGTWTVDKLTEMALAVINDMNGDGLYDGEDDIVGANFGVANSVSLFAGCGQFIAEKDDTGKLVLVLNSERTLMIGEKLRRFYENAGSNVTSDYHNVQKSFSSGTVLFTGGHPNSMANVTDYDFETGIVPMPKFDEAQDKYLCYDWADVMGISNGIKNPEMVGAVLEFLSWDSKNEVFPTYYDVLLKTRYSKDMETREMMNIIFDSLVYEIGYTYFSMQPGFCELWYTGPHYLLWGETNFAAKYRAYKNPARSTINSYYEELAKFEGPLEEETTPAS